MKKWLIRHPRTLGVLFLIASAFAFREGIEDAKIAKRFADAKAVSAEVVSVTKRSGMLPRWNAEVSWREAPARKATETVVIGTGKGWSDPAASPGQSLDIVVARDGGPDAALLAWQAKKAVMKLGGFEVGRDEFWFGVAFALGGLLCLVFAKSIEEAVKD